jgi:hypothetical protein
MFHAKNAKTIKKECKNYDFRFLHGDLIINSLRPLREPNQKINL